MRSQLSSFSRNVRGLVKAFAIAHFMGIETLYELTNCHLEGLLELTTQKRKARSTRSIHSTF